jgi:hypothetical protein
MTDEVGPHLLHLDTSKDAAVAAPSIQLARARFREILAPGAEPVAAS